MPPSPADARLPAERATFPGDERASAAARRFTRDLLRNWSATHPQLGERLIQDAALLVSELVTNAVMHAGTEVEVGCWLESDHPDWALTPGPPPDRRRPTALVVEVADRHPSRGVHPATGTRGQGRGLQLLSGLANAWGVTYRRTDKAVWFRLVAGEEPEAPRPDQRESADPPASAARGEWTQMGGPSFLAEASELLAGQLDEDMVAALAGQLLVPRLGDWCAVWLSGEGGTQRLSRVWHVDERRIERLRRLLERDPPPPGLSSSGVPWPWPDDGQEGSRGSALAFSLVAGGEVQGVLLLGRAGRSRITDSQVWLAEDVARRVAQSLVTARRYARQTSISRALQSRQLPASLATIPGVEKAIVYEPSGEGLTVGGDFYDLFPVGERRWCFLLGDVSGHDPEAMSITGLARHLVRLLAREGHGVEAVLDRLNVAMAEEGAEAVAAGVHLTPRFLSLLYGELEPYPVDGGARCTVASAGHPLPLRLTADGTVVTAAEPQMLLGVDELARYKADTFDLAPGETLLCVTDGVTERRDGTRQLDDHDGLARLLRECAGMGAQAVAERIRQAVHEFGAGPLDDDMAILVLEALPGQTHTP
ncbi:SpoIIE family protein phosphatase [Streptomyces sp. NPDC005438]|uniref:SpoIIE family protein phosphatase n=1 Tax=Streptomyces sp. NPDC005438 TaxID=3156880 RepID=UPI00339E5E0E